MTAGDLVSCQIIRQIWEKLSPFGPCNIAGLVTHVPLRRLTYLGCYELGHRLRLGSLQNDGRSVDVVVVALRHLQLDAVVAVGINVGISIAVRDDFPTAPCPLCRRLVLLVVQIAGEQASTLLPFEIYKLALALCTCGQPDCLRMLLKAESTCLVGSAARRRGMGSRLPVMALLWTA